ncbi:hypothetical protein [Calidifontibacter terrae]
MLTEEQIGALSKQERRDLIQRLQRPLDPLPKINRVRRVRLWMMVLCTALLIPWTAYLAWTLPEGYRVNNWSGTWVGFDLILLVLMITNVVLGLMRRLLVVLSAFSTGVVLICDAWFDVMTAGGDDRMQAILSALLLELPVAYVLMIGVFRILKLSATSQWLLEPEDSVWNLCLPNLSPTQGPKIARDSSG